MSLLIYVEWNKIFNQVRCLMSETLIRDHLKSAHYFYYCIILIKSFASQLRTKKGPNFVSDLSALRESLEVFGVVA